MATPKCNNIGPGSYHVYLDPSPVCMCGRTDKRLYPIMKLCPTCNGTGEVKK